MDISQHEEGFSAMQEVKRRFFALRNGIISDTLRKAGSPFRIIFGLNLPQIKEIAGFTGSDRQLAEALWANTTTRESMMLAPMIFPREEFTAETAARWLAECPSAEISDTLCHSLLRHQDYAAELALSTIAKSDASERELYGALRLILNIISKLNPSDCRTAVDKIPPTAPASVLRLKTQILDELDFIEGS